MRMQMQGQSAVVLRIKEMAAGGVAKICHGLPQVTESRRTAPAKLFRMRPAYMVPGVLTHSA